MARTVDFGFC